MPQKLGIIGLPYSYRKSLKATSLSWLPCRWSAKNLRLYSRQHELQWDTVNAFINTDCGYVGLQYDRCLHKYKHPAQHVIHQREYSTSYHDFSHFYRIFSYSIHKNLICLLNRKISRLKNIFL